MKISDKIQKTSLLETSLNAQVLDSTQLLQELDILENKITASSTTNTDTLPLTNVGVNLDSIESIEDIMNTLLALVEQLGAKQICDITSIPNRNEYIEMQLSPMTSTNGIPDYNQQEIYLFCPELDSEEFDDIVYVEVYNDNDEAELCYKFDDTSIINFNLGFNDKPRTIRIYGLATTPTIFGALPIYIDNSHCQLAIENENKTIVEFKIPTSTNQDDTLYYSLTLDDFSLNHELIQEYSSCVIGIKFKKGITNSIIKANNYNLSQFESLQYVIFENDEDSTLTLDSDCGFQNVQNLYFINLPNQCQRIEAATFAGCINLGYIVMPLAVIQAMINEDITITDNSDTEFFVADQYHSNDVANYTPSDDILLSEGNKTVMDTSRGFSVNTNGRAGLAPVIICYPVTVYDEYDDVIDEYVTCFPSQSGWGGMYRPNLTKPGTVFNKGTTEDDFGSTSDIKSHQRRKNPKGSKKGPGIVKTNGKGEIISGGKK